MSTDTAIENVAKISTHRNERKKYKDVGCPVFTLQKFPYIYIHIYINYLFDTSITLIKKSIYQFIKLLSKTVNFQTIREQKFIILTNQQFQNIGKLKSKTS